MKFIVDAQLPKSLSEFLNSKGFDSIHTFDLPDKNKTKDYQITNLSIKENRILITKDNDFLESFLLNSKPEKLILVKTGNIRNDELIQIFSKHIEKILILFNENSLIEINKTEIIAHI